MKMEARVAVVRQTWGGSRESIRSIIAEFQTAHPSIPESKLIDLVAERIHEDMDSARAAAEYCVVNAVEAQIRYGKRGHLPSANVSTPTEIQRDIESRLVTKDAINAAAKAAAEQILFLNLEMPNGKRMRYCTGADMAKFGAGYARIAKKVGSTKMVGSVLDEKAVRELMR
jgi:hypothetical protein